MNFVTIPVTMSVLFRNRPRAFCTRGQPRLDSGFGHKMPIGPRMAEYKKSREKVQVENNQQQCLEEMVVKVHGGTSWTEAPVSAWGSTGLLLVLLAFAVSGAALGGEHEHKSNDSATTLPPPPSPSPQALQAVISPQDEARMPKMYRRMILPLLVGVLLKVASLLPVILGKLALLAVGSVMTSKLALMIAAILAIHKYQTESSWPASTPEDTAVHAVYPYRRRG